MASFHDTDPQAALIPEILEAAAYLPSKALIVHSFSRLFININSQGIALDVLPQEESSSSSGFGVCTERPSGITGIFFSPNTDFEASLPNAITTRPDNPGRRMLKQSGVERIIATLQFGSVYKDFGEIGYGGTFGIEHFWLR